MQNEPKKVPFKWELGDKTVSLQVGSYVYGDRLYIGMISYDEDGPEPFTDVTVNIPAYFLEANEAFICGDFSNDLLNFITENDLGKVLPYKVQSGYERYSAVAFDLERLKEFDPEGTVRYMKICNLAERTVTAPKKKKSRDMER